MLLIYYKYSEFLTNSIKVKIILMGLSNSETSYFKFLDNFACQCLHMPLLKSTSLGIKLWYLPLFYYS